jgi:hypothetical protein
MPGKKTSLIDLKPMGAEAIALAKVLLAHHAALSKKKVRTPQDMFPYKKLCERAGLPWLERGVGKPLGEIAEWCHIHGWPPLNSLAVNSWTLEPGGGEGGGYDRAAGCSIVNWWNDVERCLACDDYPDPSEL